MLRPDLKPLGKAFEKTRRTRDNVENLRDILDGGEIEEFVNVIDRAARNLAEWDSLQSSLDDVLNSLDELAELGLYDSDQAALLRSNFETVQDIIADRTDNYTAVSERFEEAKDKAVEAVDSLDEDYDAEQRDDLYEAAKEAASELYDELENVLRG